ncbi:hypothetical protein OEZ85_002110 [Tetradesmus obliquus]|uniref:Uncharacterized protein n=1 Tax=Tetradesmus obliquus TaxID=3088 RepID=A0ABY8U2N1_TETOB|nr:hypothetical protein OEZ85_002110 [Tetradesmus obliquus]
MPTSCTYVVHPPDTDTMMSKFILAAVLLVSVLLSADASNPIRGLFSKGARKLQQASATAFGNIDANYAFSTNNVLWSSQTVITRDGVTRKISPMVKGKSKSKSGRKLMQPAGTIDVNYGWSTNNLLYTWQYKLDGTGSTQKVSPMVKGKSKSKSGRKLMQPAGTIDVNYGWSTNNLLYTWQYKLDGTGSTQKVSPMVKSKSKSKSG